MVASPELSPQARKELEALLGSLKRDPCANCRRSSPEGCPEMNLLRAVSCRKGYEDSGFSGEYTRKGVLSN